MELELCRRPVQTRGMQQRRSGAVLLRWWEVRGRYGWVVCKGLKACKWQRGKAEPSFSQLLGNQVRSAVVWRSGMINPAACHFLFSPLVRHRCFQMKAHSHKGMKAVKGNCAFYKNCPSLEVLVVVLERKCHSLVRNEKAGKQASCCFHFPQHVYVCEWW